MAGLIAEIAARIDTLRKSERKVAEAVLRAPELIMRQSLATLAQKAGVSEPTVIRFCRALGATGFPDFKLRLAQSLATGAPFIHREVTTEDDLPAIVAKVFESSIGTLASLRQAIDLAALERATTALAAAKRIDCYGVGLSAIAAMDAYQKFMRLGVATSVSLEGHLQTMSACTLQPDDVALAFSYTGQIRDIIRTARAAREQGAFVIAVTRSGSMLSKVASMTIGVDTAEDTFVYAPMTTRIAHLVCVDVLATSVALRRGANMAVLFQRIKESLDDQRIVDLPAAAPAEPVRLADRPPGRRSAAS